MDRKQEVVTRLQAMISEQLGVPQEEITAKSTWSALGADSLDRLEMSRVIEDAFKVEIPHETGERLNTVGETIEHLLNSIGKRAQTSNILIEAVTTAEQWAEISEIRAQVFTAEFGFSVKPLAGPGETSVWHFMARDHRQAVGALSVVDTTGNSPVHEQYSLKFGKDDRVARYAQLAILKPYRKGGIFEMLMETAQKAVIRPNEFAVGWLLYPAAQAHSSRLVEGLGFTVQRPLLKAEFGNCHALIRRESALLPVTMAQQSFAAAAR